MWGNFSKHFLNTVPCGGLLLLSACGFSIKDIGPLVTCSSATTQTFYFNSLADLAGTADGSRSLSNNVWKADVGSKVITPITLNTATGLDSTGATVSADGSKIFYYSKQALNGAWNGTGTLSYNIWVMNADGSNRIALTQNTLANLDSTNPMISPDGTKVAFVSKTAIAGTWDGAGALSPNVWIMKSDGTGLLALTQNTSASLDSAYPVFSPDSSHISFASKTALNGTWNGAGTASKNYWTIKVDGSVMTALSSNTLVNRDAGISMYTPDGTQIITASPTALDGSWNGTIPANNIWIMNADGSNRQALTHNTVAGGSLASTNGSVSPDGTRITFQSKTALDGTWDGTGTAQYNLWIMNLDGTNRVALTRDQTALGISAQQSFSPDSQKIMYQSHDNFSGVADAAINTPFNLWVVNADGTGRAPLTFNTLASFDVSVSNYSGWHQGTSCQ
jgi:hypothetical protein